MSPECRKCRQYMSAYLDGETTSAEEQFIRSHVQTCQDCREALRAYQTIHAQFQNFPRPTPPPTLRRAVLAGVRGGVNTVGVPRNRQRLSGGGFLSLSMRWGVGLATATAVFVIALTALVAALLAPAKTFEVVNACAQSACTVPADQSIKINFSQPLDDKQIEQINQNPGSYLKIDPPLPIAAQVQDDGKTVVLQPKATLPASQTITVTLSSNLQDKNKQPIQGNPVLKYSVVEPSPKPIPPTPTSTLAPPTTTQAAKTTEAVSTTTRAAVTTTAPVDTATVTPAPKTTTVATKPATTTPVTTRPVITPTPPATTTNPVLVTQTTAITSTVTVTATTPTVVTGTIGSTPTITDTATVATTPVVTVTPAPATTTVTATNTTTVPATVTTAAITTTPTAAVTNTLQSAACPIPPVAGFGYVYKQNSAVAAAFGCPLDKEIPITYAYRAFQNGFMYYRQDTQQVWVFYGKDDGTWEVYSGITYVGPAPAGSPKPPSSNLYVPDNGFGQVWYNHNLVGKLGWSVQAQESSGSPPAANGAVQLYAHNCLMLYNPSTDVSGGKHVYALFGNGTFINRVVPATP